MPKQKRLLPVGRPATVDDKPALDGDSEFGVRRASIFQKTVWATCDWSMLPQSWRRRLRKQFARKIKGPFDHSHDGMKFRLYPAENYCDRVLFGRDVLPEKEEHLALLPLLKPSMTFVDIGANVGTYSVFVGSKVQGNLTLLAFEPHPRTFEKLRFNLRANQLPVDHLFNLGVGPDHASVPLWSDGGSNIGHTSMLKSGTSNPKVSNQVTIAPLLPLLLEHDVASIDLLKIDIEGYEDRALAPFFDSASNDLLPKHLLIEVAHQHLWERDLLQILDQKGYELTFSTKENRLFSRQLLEAA